jgi:hypothetical protein
MSAKCPLFYSDLGAKSSQRKEHPNAMAFGFPALLNKSGGCGTRFAFKTARVFPNLAKC